MTESELASQIASQVVSDTSFWIALVGLVGAIIGSVLTIFGNLILHKVKDKPQRELENSRISMLKTMLNDKRFSDKWRKLSTLSAVLGTDDQETKRLLFKAGARGSEKNDGKWGLVKHHPFPDSE